MTQTAMWAIGILASLVALTFTILGFVFGRMKEMQTKAFSDGRTSESINNLKDSVVKLSCDIGKEFGAMREKMQTQERKQEEYFERLVIVEAGVGTAHKRIDRIEQRAEFMERKDM